MAFGDFRLSLEDGFVLGFTSIAPRSEFDQLWGRKMLQHVQLTFRDDMRGLGHTTNKLKQKTNIC